jgi:hypothetical protein
MEIVTKPNIGLSGNDNFGRVIKMAGVTIL